MEADPLFTLEIVQEFMISRGGKVKNSDLVTHFKSFLNDPVKKVANREKFKSHVNTLSVVKLDESGEKMLVLKKKYREGGDVDDFTAHMSTPIVDKGHLTGAPKQKKAKTEQGVAEKKTEEVVVEETARAVSDEKEIDIAAAEEPNSSQAQVVESPQEAAVNVVDADKEVPMELVSSADEKADLKAAKKEEGEEEEKEDHFEDASMEVAVDESAAAFGNARSTMQSNDAIEGTATDVEEKRDEKVVEKSEIHEYIPEAALIPQESKAPEMLASQIPIVPPPVPQAAIPPPLPSLTYPPPPAPAENGMVNVKDRAKHLNKIGSESNMFVPTPASGASRKTPERQLGSTVTKDEVDSHSTSGPITIGPQEREWILAISKAEYHPVFKLLNDRPGLVNVKDFMTGFTALHWATKHGNIDVVKLLCGRDDVKVNAKSNGGYTPLHLAVIYEREHIIQQLIAVYKADVNIRDYSGRQAKHYINAHSKITTNVQSLLKPSRLSVAPKMGTMFHGTKVRPAISVPVPARAETMVKNAWSPQLQAAIERSRSPSPAPAPAPAPALAAGSPRLARKGSLPSSDSSAMLPPAAIPVNTRYNHKATGIKESSSDMNIVSSSSSNIPRTTSSPEILNIEPTALFETGV